MNFKILINMIMGISDNYVLGTEKPNVDGSSIPWKQKWDMRNFAALTKEGEGFLITGSKTEPTMPKLKGRTLIVLTHNKNYVPKDSDTVVKHSVEELLEFLQGVTNPIWVIGGAQIYNLLKPYIGALFLTRIHANIDVADPVFAPSEFKWDEDGMLVDPEMQVESQKEIPADEDNQYPMTYYVYRKEGIAA